MSANSRPAYGAVYPHRSDNPDRRNSPAYHRRRFYRLGGLRYIFRRTGGTWKRHSFITDFTLPVCCDYHPNCVFTQQAFRSGWRLECVLDHRNDYSNHFYLCLPQGNSIKLAEPVNSKINVALCRHRKNHTAAIRCPPPDFMLLIVFSSTFTSTGFETWAFIPVAREC